MKTTSSKGKEAGEEESDATVGKKEKKGHYEFVDPVTFISAKNAGDDDDDDDDDDDSLRIKNKKKNEKKIENLKAMDVFEENVVGKIRSMIHAENQTCFEKITQFLTSNADNNSLVPVALLVAGLNPSDSEMALTDFSKYLATNPKTSRFAILRSSACGKSIKMAMNTISNQILHGKYRESEELMLMEMELQQQQQQQQQLIKKTRSGTSNRMKRKKYNHNDDDDQDNLSLSLSDDNDDTDDDDDDNNNNNNDQQQKQHIILEPKLLRSSTMEDTIRSQFTAQRSHSGSGHVLATKTLAKTKKAVSTMHHLASWYEQLSHQTTARRKKNKNEQEIRPSSLTIIIQDFESFSEQVLTSICDALVYYRSQCGIPFTIVFQVTSANPNRFHERLSSHCVSGMRINKFRLFESLKMLDYVFDVLLSENCPLHLSRDVYCWLNDRFLSTDFSLRSLIQALRYTFLCHYNSIDSRLLPVELTLCKTPEEVNEVARSVSHPEFRKKYISDSDSIKDMLVLRRTRISALKILHNIREVLSLLPQSKMLFTSRLAITQPLLGKSNDAEKRFHSLNLLTVKRILSLFDDVDEELRSELDHAILQEDLAIIEEENNRKNVAIESTPQIAVQKRTITPPPEYALWKPERKREFLSMQYFSNNRKDDDLIMQQQQQKQESLNQKKKEVMTRVWEFITLYESTNIDPPYKDKSLGELFFFSNVNKLKNALEFDPRLRITKLLSSPPRGSFYDQNDNENSKVNNDMEVTKCLYRQLQTTKEKRIGMLEWYKLFCSERLGVHTKDLTPNDLKRHRLHCEYTLGLEELKYIGMIKPTNGEAFTRLIFDPSSSEQQKKTQNNKKQRIQDK